VAPGELLALIGPNGAGKSTCFNMVNGQLKADAAASPRRAGDLVGLKPREIWRLGRGPHLPDRRDLRLDDGAWRTCRWRCSRTPGPAVPLVAARGRACRDEALALLARSGMAAQADRPCSVLAYGDVKRVELAIALANRPSCC
jgi:branched-chain amino acid transport system ATP-binding protein